MHSSLPIPFLPFLLTASIFTTNDAHSQIPAEAERKINGLSICGAASRVGLIDEYLSREPYKGSMNHFGASWRAWHETYEFRLSIEYRSSHDLHNYNVAAEVSEFSLSLSYLYPVRALALPVDSLLISLGPAAEVFTHFRSQNIANRSASEVSSSASMINASLAVEAVYPVSPAIRAEAALVANLLSAVFRPVNRSRSDESTMKLLTPFGGLSFASSIGLRWVGISPVSFAAAYRFRFVRISAWDYFLSTHDELHAAATVHF